MAGELLMHIEDYIHECMRVKYKMHCEYNWASFNGEKGYQIYSH